MKAVLEADPCDLVVEISALIQVAMLIVVRLIFEIFAIMLGHCLPGSTDLLHDLEGAHDRVGSDDFRPRFLHEDHVG